MENGLQERIIFLSFHINLLHNFHFPRWVSAILCKSRLTPREQNHFVLSQLTQEAETHFTAENIAFRAKQ